MKFPAELLKGSTKNLILAILSEQPLYGYEIVKRIQRKSAGALVLGEGSMYPALHALEKSGYIIGQWEESPEGRERKYYSLTRKGRKQLKEGIAAWKQFTLAVNKIVLDAA